jgi:peptide/nickel transport system ATP-binding protein/oligopeptide transport system ATP-binding protein
MTMPEILRAEALVKDFKVPKKDGWFGSERTRALDGVSLGLQAGETLAVVGESGSGKSTLGRALLWLDPADSGTVSYEGQSLAALAARDLRKLRRDLQLVSQDPYASLDPRWRAKDIVTENLAVHDGLKGDAVLDAAKRLLVQVGLAPDMVERYPHEFSGGQRQRLAIARAIATKPKLIVADEPVSALDLELQVQILELLKLLKVQMGLSLIFITHDLKLVRGFCDRMIVMQKGVIVEAGAVEGVFKAPQHAYTKELLAAILPLPIRRPGGR